jgi:hypothetical protein
MIKVLTVFLTHQAPDSVRAMLNYWRDLDANQSFLIVNGGLHDLTDCVDCATVVVNDPALRTRDHGREKQSYQGVFQAAAPYVAASGAEFVSFVEYDEVPLQTDLNARMIAAIEQEKADVLGFRLYRVDGTSHHQYLDHCKDPHFLNYCSDISCREDKGTVLSMLGCGSFWRRDAFLAVAALKPTRIYLEMFMPTAAHHLGFRVRPLPPEQERFMAPEVIKNVSDLEIMKRQGAWRIHPVKEMWLGKM